MGVSVTVADLPGKVFALKCELSSSSAKYIILVMPSNANNLQAVNPFLRRTIDLSRFFDQQSLKYEEKLLTKGVITAERPCNLKTFGLCLLLQ
jgi:hypothetical protein